jgi:hypothetical protein
MPSIPHIVDALRSVLIESAHTAAQATGLVQRQRRLDGAQFVQTLVAAWLAQPEATYETMVGIAADLGVTITPQALAERFTPAAVACLAQVLAATMRQVMTSEPAVLPVLDRFVAVEVQDSTVIALPDALATHFQGCGSSRSHSAAAVKAQFRWELRSGRLDGPLLQNGRASDRAIDFRVRALPGTLRIRDLGYWHLDDLASDDQDGRYWLTRLKPGTALTTTDGQRHDLVALLAARPDAPIDLAVRLGVIHRLPARLIARRVAADVEAARVRQAERTARRKGRIVSATTRALCAWDILVTNVPASMLPAADAWILRGVRWQIELLFKLWKQHGRLDESRGQVPTRVLAELYAKFIGLLIQHWLLLASCWDMPNRSLVKAARVVRSWTERWIGALGQPERLTQILTDLVAAIRRGARQTCRRKTPNTWQLLGGAPATLT